MKKTKSKSVTQKNEHKIEVKPTKKINMIKDMNMWMMVSIALFVLLIISLFLGKGATTNKVSPDEATQNVLDFANKYLLQPGMTLEVQSVKEKSGLYEIIFTYQGQEIVSYASIDGKIFMPEGIEMIAVEQAMLAQGQLVAPPETQTAPINNAEIEPLITCLEQKQFLIYGASWCPYCQSTLELFQGADTSGIYVECTEQEALCMAEGITGYPTIKVAGNPYQGQRTLQAFAQATGC